MLYGLFLGLALFYWLPQALYSMKFECVGCFTFIEGLFFFPDGDTELKPCTWSLPTGEAYQKDELCNMSFASVMHLLFQAAKLVLLEAYRTSTCCIIHCFDCVILWASIKDANRYRVFCIYILLCRDCLQKIIINYYFLSVLCGCVGGVYSIRECKYEVDVL